MLILHPSCPSCTVLPILPTAGEDAESRRVEPAKLANPSASPSEAASGRSLTTTGSTIASGPSSTSAIAKPSS